MTKPNHSTLSQKELKKYILYNPDTGVFTRKITVNGNAKKGDTAGCLHSNGYIDIKILKIRYASHRIAWLYMTGSFPKNRVDHRNLNKKDNRWLNLRECSQSQNQANCKKMKNNTTGYKGVVRQNKSKKFVGQIVKNKINYYLGTYNCKHEAAQAYNKKALELYGEFAYLNEINDG